MFSGRTVKQPDAGDDVKVVVTSAVIVVSVVVACAVDDTETHR